MALYTDGLTQRFNDILNLPILERCTQLSIFFQRCSQRELHEIFPTFIKSAFGNGCDIGWGLRVTIFENTQPTFEALGNFFGTQGPAMNVCYRLLSDSIKFDLPLDCLTRKMVDTLRSGQYPIFYSDLLNIDSYRRIITSLSLNSFDYYMMHFLLHAMVPLHKIYPAALKIHNERIKSVYFFLAAEYMQIFLPVDPDGIILPQNAGAGIKAPPQIPVQTLSPQMFRKPKYLRLPNMNLFSNNKTINDGGNSSMNDEACDSNDRFNSWRIESILHLFLDLWLSYDFNEHMPSTEFIRIVRVLVKQVHAFANSGHLEYSTYSHMRKISLSIMNSQFYIFIRNAINHWPLDSSMNIVMELWVSFLQPWRYTHLRSQKLPKQLEQQQQLNGGGGGGANIELPIHDRYNNFIADNLRCYTQIFLLFLPRFERLDYKTQRSNIMLHRFLKVFSQTNLALRLHRTEELYIANVMGLDTPEKHANYLRNKINGNSDWDPYKEQYTPLFSADVCHVVCEFMKTLCINRIYIINDIQSLKHEIDERKRSYTIFKKIYNLFFGEYISTQASLDEIQKIPDILDNSIKSLCYIFQVPYPDMSDYNVVEYDNCYDTSANFSMLDSSSFLDITKITPAQMSNNAACYKMAIDPAILPVQANEFALLVRFLNILSYKINEKCGNEICKLWQRQDYLSRIIKQFIEPPMIQQWFGKSRGMKELLEEQLPPRICLRPMASYQFLMFILFSMIVGFLIWRSFSLGLLLLLACKLIYLMIITCWS